MRYQHNILAITTLSGLIFMPHSYPRVRSENLATLGFAKNAFGVHVASFAWSSGGVVRFTATLFKGRTSLVLPTHRWQLWQFIGAFTCRSSLIAVPISARDWPSFGAHVRFVTSPMARSCCVGSLWHWRHQPIVRSLSWVTTFISLTWPWQETQDTPLFTCAEW